MTVSFVFDIAGSHKVANRPEEKISLFCVFFSVLFVHESEKYHLGKRSGLETNALVEKCGGDKFSEGPGTRFSDLVMRVEGGLGAYCTF